MKKLIKLNSDEDIRKAKFEKMCIVKVSFPGNPNYDPIYLASIEEIKREDISEYLSLNGYDYDEYNIYTYVRE